MPKKQFSSQKARQAAGRYDRHQASGNLRRVTVKPKRLKKVAPADQPDPPAGGRAAPAVPAAASSWSLAPLLAEALSAGAAGTNINGRRRR